jgi:1-acyl-sn-glycerol-3-phosphate acyltransferase
MISRLRHNRIFIVGHTVVIYTWTIAATLLFGILAILVSFLSKKGDSVHHVARIWGRGILWVSGVRVRISGLENIDPKSSCIVMANHLSQFDIPVLLSSMPFQFRWLAKAELFKIPIFGRGMRGAGYISIDRSDRKSAFQSLERAAKSIRDGTSVMIFPEGTRSPDGGLLPFKKGGFVLAVDAGVPIIPLVIFGTHDIMPKGRLLIQWHPVHIRFLPAVDTSGYSRKTKDDLLARVRSDMLEGLEGASPGGRHG